MTTQIEILKIVPSIPKSELANNLKLLSSLKVEASRLQESSIAQSGVELEEILKQLVTVRTKIENITMAEYHEEKVIPAGSKVILNDEVFSFIESNHLNETTNNLKLLVETLTGLDKKIFALLRSNEGYNYLFNNNFNSLRELVVYNTGDKTQLIESIVQLKDLIETNMNNLRTRLTDFPNASAPYGVDSINLTEKTSLKLLRDVYQAVKKIEVK